MPEPEQEQEPAFDLSQPSPDEGHEAIRLAVVKAIEDLGHNTESVDVSFSLVDMLFVLLEESLADRSALNIRVDAAKIQAQTAIANADVLQRQMTQLADRLEGLVSQPPFAG
jgi:hypothetical protein